MDGLESLAGAMPQLNGLIATVMLERHRLWWTESSQQVAPCLLVHRGLPAACSFTALLDGQWLAHGWQGSGAR